MDEDPVAAMDALVARLASTLTGGGSAAGVPTSGYAAEGRIVARTTPDGRVSELTIEPLVARMPREEAAAAIVTAVNEALDARPEAGESGSLLPELRAIQQESVAVTKSMNSALLSALEQLKASQ